MDAGYDERRRVKKINGSLRFIMSNGRGEEAPIWVLSQVWTWYQIRLVGMRKPS
ncbi:hypothetical protein Hanom_Chr15g01385711 [Helianthus anomalus]